MREVPVRRGCYRRDLVQRVELWFGMVVKYLWLQRMCWFLGAQQTTAKQSLGESIAKLLLGTR